MGDLAVLPLDRERTQHEAGEVDHPLLLVLRRVRAHDVTELALVALGDHAVVLGVGEHADVVRAEVGQVVDVGGVVRVDHLEERLEARAQPHTEAAVAAHLERAVTLGARCRGVEVVGSERVVDRHAVDLTGDGSGPGETCPRGRVRCDPHQGRNGGGRPRGSRAPG